MAVALLLVLTLSALGLVIRPRSELSLDAKYYVSMASGQYANVVTPYRYRVLAPWLASLIPVEPSRSLQWLTWLSLGGCFFIALRQSALLDVPLGPAALAVIAWFCSRPVLYSYYNPQLVDAPALLALFILVFLFLRGAPILFTAALLIGALVRESAIFVAPAWLLSRQWKRGAWIFAAAVGVFVVPRILFPGNLHYDDYIREGVDKKMNLYWFAPFVKGTVLSWQGLWLLAGYGLFKSIRRVGPALIALGGGCLASMIVAGDYERLIAIMAPLMVPAIAVALQDARGSKIAIGFFAAVLPAQYLFGNPYVLPHLPLEIYRTLLIPVTILSWASCGLVMWKAVAGAGTPFRTADA